VKGNNLKSYGSLLIGCRMFEEAYAAPRTIFGIEHIPSGEHERTVSLADTEAWMIKGCRPDRGKFSLPESGPQVGDG
jgi:hypothetical protein